MDSSEYFSLWPTNFLVSSIESLEPYNDEIYQLSTKFYSGFANRDGSFNYRQDTTSFFMSHKSEALIKLLEVKTSKVKEYLRTFYPKIEVDDLNFYSDTHVIKQDGANIRGSMPHKHIGNQLIVTYYPKTRLGPADAIRSDQPGAVCFQDPRPLQSTWMLRTEKKVFPISTTTGTLVVFPGYLNHWTFPFLDASSDKIGIVSKFKFCSRADLNEERYYKNEEVLNFQSQK